MLIYLYLSLLPDSADPSDLGVAEAKLYELVRWRLEEELENVYYPRQLAQQAQGGAGRPVSTGRSGGWRRRNSG